MSDAAAVKRPTWVVVLALAMLMSGGNLLVQGIGQLRGDAEVGGTTVLSQSVLRDMRAATQAMAAAHPVAVRVNAVSKVAMGLVMLFAVAAVFASDPRARRASIVAAWLGIGFYVGDILFSFLVVRKGIVAMAPLLATLMASNSPGTAVPSPEDVVTLMDMFMGVMGALEIGFSVVLLAYFGGRKGRLFYGLERQPHHGA
jgi:hypothetical protein